MGTVPAQVLLKLGELVLTKDVVAQVAVYLFGVVIQAARSR
jgi:hypothetical protein